MSLNVNRNVGYTVEGNPTIVDGVASGFSDSDFLQINTSPFTPNNITEIVIKFTPTEKKQGYILGGLSANGQGGIYLTIVNTQFRYGIVADKIQQQTAGSAYQIKQFNIPYYMHFVFYGNNLNWKLGISTDGLNPVYGLQNVATGMLKTTILTLGKTSVAGYQLRGSIDLNETYIKVNGVTWFNGKEQASTTVNEVYLNRNVGYDIVGNPTINDGLLSVSSNEDIVSASATLTYNYNSNIEFYARFKTEDTVDTTRRIIGKNNTTGVNVLWTDANSVYYVTPDGVGFNPLSWYKLQADTWYRVKVTGNNGTWTIGIYDDNGTLIKDNTKQLTSGTEQSFIPVFNSYHGNNLPQKYLDLNETYIKVNGVTWFSGKEQTSPTVNEVYLNRNVGYTKVGNPTITEGIATCPTYNDIIKANISITYSYDSDVVFYARFKRTNSEEGNPEMATIISDSNIYNQPLLWCYKRNLCFKPFDTTIYPGYNNVHTETWYRLKASGKNKIWTVELQNDNGSLIDIDSTEITSGTRTFWPLFASWMGTVNPGVTLDLNETYIKINGVTWFSGKQTATTPIWTRSV